MKAMGGSLFIFLAIIMMPVAPVMGAEMKKGEMDHGLGDWWVKNPLKYDPVPAAFLYHLEGAYTYSELGGNVDAKIHNGEASLALRKYLFTSISSYEISKSKMDIMLSGASTSLESQSFHQKFRYGLTDRMEAAGGIIWLKDGTKYIDSRYIYYAGARFGIIDRPDLALKCGGFFGYSDTEYMNSSITGIRKFSTFTPVEDYDTDLVYFAQMLKWKINKTITFKENATYMLSLEDTKYYYWNLKLALTFKLTKNTSFLTSYTIKYDKNSFTEALNDYLDNRRAMGGSVGDIDTTDTILAVGIKVNL